MTPFVKNGLTVLVLIIIVAGGYYLYNLRTSSNLNTGQLATSESKIASDRFVRELEKIRKIDLNGNLFQDPRFNSLVNFSQPIESQEVGRDNPFEPVE